MSILSPELGKNTSLWLHYGSYILFISFYVILFSTAQELQGEIGTYFENQCGVHMDHGQPSSNMTHHRSRRSLANDEAVIASEVKIIELSIVCDKRCYDRWAANYAGQDIEDWFYKAVQTASLKVSPLRTRIVLSQLEVWSQFDIVPITSADSEPMMDIINAYRADVLVPRQWTDATFLVSGQDIIDTSSGGGGGIAGLFVSAGICTTGGYGLLKLGSSQSRDNFAQFIVHELGHGMGSGHDTSSCDCGAGSYINCCMAPSVNSYQINNYKWSDCAKADIAAVLGIDHSSCMTDTPTLYMPQASSPCGNGILDGDEQCDCGGGSIDGCADFCDDSCQLVGDGTQCEPSSACCESTGQFSTSSTVCRASRGSCDAEETCTGSAGLCPDDVFTADGSDCTDSLGEASYCYDGVCRTRNNQCKNYWNDAYSSAAEVCWQYSTPYGSISANCGETGRLPTSTYTTCSSFVDPYYMCGKLQCNGPTEDYPFPYDHSVVSYYRVPKQNSRISTDHCRYLLHYLWEDGKGDSVYVQDGTKCGDGKVCSNFNCVDKSGFTNEAVVQAICGNGVVETGEDCDCGAAVANCACCSECSFLGADSTCLYNDCGRCSGTAADCTVDAPQMTACDSGNGQCYKGVCASPDARCKEYFVDASATVNTAAMAYHLSTPVHQGYPYQWNGGGYLLRDASNNFVDLTNLDHYVQAESAECGTLLCSTTNSAYVYYDDSTLRRTTYTVTVEPNQNFPGTRMIYYKSEMVRNRTTEYSKYLPVFVPDGSPCTKDGQAGYCSTRYIQLDPNVWTWYLRAKCIAA